MNLIKIINRESADNNKLRLIKQIKIDMKNKKSVLEFRTH